jgi:hypothetical protein
VRQKPIPEGKIREIELRGRDFARGWFDRWEEMALRDFPECLPWMRSSRKHLTNLVAASFLEGFSQGYRESRSDAN